MRNIKKRFCLGGNEERGAVGQLPNLMISGNQMKNTEDLKKFYHADAMPIYSNENIAA